MLNTASTIVAAQIPSKTIFIEYIARTYVVAAAMSSRVTEMSVTIAADGTTKTNRVIKSAADTA
jgi:hypothetical protein